VPLVRLWPLAVGLVLIVVFATLEHTAPVRASFTLTGLVDCGRSSGATCSIGDTLVILSKDSGNPVKITINVSWLKDLPKLDQDDYVSIEIEKLPDGTFMALNLTDISGQSGSSNPGTRGAKVTTTTTTDDSVSVCSGETAVYTTAPLLAFTTITTTFGTATTEVSTTTLFGTGRVSTVTELPCGESGTTTTTTTTTVNSDIT